MQRKWDREEDMARVRIPRNRNGVIKPYHTTENNLTKDHYLGISVADLFLLLLRLLLCENCFSPPPAPPFPGLWVSFQVNERHCVLPKHFRLLLRCFDNAQIAGIDDYLTKVQHRGLKEM